jgi:hypothetical protein
MCSFNCPCPTSAATTWTTFSEADLNSVGRTKVVGTTELDVNNNTRLFFASTGNTYSNFKNCSDFLTKKGMTYDD